MTISGSHPLLYRIIEMQALHTLAIAGPRESGAAVIFESSFCRLRSELALRLDAHSEGIREDGKRVYLYSFDRYNHTGKQSQSREHLFQSGTAVISRMLQSRERLSHVGHQDLLIEPSVLSSRSGGFSVFG